MSDPRRIGSYRAINFSFVVSAPPGPVADHLREVLHPLCSLDRSQTAPEYVIEGDPVRGWSLTGDGVGIADGTTPEHLCRMLVWHVNESARATSGDLTVLHAAAASTEDGRAVVLPAPMDAGKSTLVTALVSAGLAYVTDELVAVRPGNVIVPYPKSITLDPGSWHLFPRLRPPPRFEELQARQWHVPADTVRPHATSREPHVALVLFPKYVPDAETRVVQLAPDAALLQLAGCTFSLDSGADRTLPVLASMASTIPCFSVRSGQLRGLVDVVLKLIRSARAADNGRASEVRHGIPTRA